MGSKGAGERIVIGLVGGGIVGQQQCEPAAQERCAAVDSRFDGDAPDTTSVTFETTGWRLCR